MKATSLKLEVIQSLKDKGLDFNKDAFQLSSTDLTLLAEYARLCKYRRPKTSYFGLSGAFYIHLKKFIK